MNTPDTSAHETGGRRHAVHARPLRVRGLSAGWDGGRPVLHGLDFDVAPGERVGLLGRNGSGKSALIETLAGTLKVRAGSVQYGGAELAGRGAQWVARAGVGSVPQRGGVFGSLTVAQNLNVGAMAHGSAATAGPAVLGAFGWIGPRLAQRADRLSGGQQRQLALARALMACPGLLLADVPLAGVAPTEVPGVVQALRRTAIAWSMGLLVAEHDVGALLALCDRVLVLHDGGIAASLPAAPLRADPSGLERYLGA